jgi:hypothetical protein
LFVYLREAVDRPIEGRPMIETMPPPKKRTGEKVQLNTDTDFTLASLRDYLNERFGQKSSGKPFTIQDIQGYEAKRHIPDAYGGYEVQVLENEEIGIKLLRLKGFSRTKDSQPAEEDDAKSWSIKMREAHEGSRWVIFKETYILIMPSGRIIAINSPTGGKLVGDAALAFAQRELGWQ